MKKVLAMALAILMIVSILPMSVLAGNDYTINSTTSTDDYYNLISKKDWDIAPGITESEIVLNNDDGSYRQALFVMEADLNNEYVKVINSYTGMVPQYGDYKTGTMSQQAAYAEANGYGNVVGAMNTTLSWYTGYPDDRLYEPLGFIMLDAEILFDPANCGYEYGKVGFPSVLVINKDFDDQGNPRPADIPKVEMPQITSAADLDGWEDQVIPCSSGYIVKDGVNVNSPSHTGGAPRSVVGIKPDGTVVIMLNDGRQSPYSAGMSMYELAEVMLDLGCSYAVNCDGGGSSTYLSQRPGEELKVNNVPSDGAERETTTGILFISTAPATGEFSRANISSEYDYYTPNSTVEFEALGTDLVGTEAEIPADAVWQLADDSFGTVENGVFVSNGKEGEVTVQLTYNGEIVGEKSINIVMPDKIAFAQENMVVPYGKTVELVINATYDSKPVCIKPADVEFVLSNSALGTIDGFNFNAAEEGTEVEPGTLTATIGELTITANLSLGKGSDVIYDFENEDLTDWDIEDNYGNYGPKGPNGKVTDDSGNYWYNGQNELGEIKIVDATTGKVRNGDYALAVECDYTQIYETGYHSLNLFFPQVDTTDALKVGFWLYVPYDARHAEFTIAGGGIGNGELSELCEGWHYITAVPNSSNAWRHINISVDDRACASTGDYYNYITEPNLNGKYTFYIDDITLDYSTAVEDRENPVFSAPAVLDSTGSTNAEISGQTISFNNPTFEVKVADFVADNATGLNASTAKAYVDGKEVACTYSNGKISVNGVVLADGIHSVKFQISDNAGNSSWVGGSVNVDAGTDASVVKVVPQDPEADRLLVGSLYWMDVVASDIKTIQKVEMTFDLNNASYWELEGMTTATGFSADWSVQEDDNIATITITRTGNNEPTGEAVIASIPVRTWESHITEYEGYEDQTPATLVSRGIIWAQSIEVALERGVITYVDSYTSNTSGTFGMDNLLVDTELFFTYYTRTSVEGAVDWINAKKAAGEGFHEHTVTALDDKDATCTENGYTDRTFCEECNSVMDWGTKVEATGHSYGVDGKCVDCGEQTTIEGLYEIDGKWYCFANGATVGGWQIIDGAKYYFDPTTKAAQVGKYVVNSLYFETDETGKAIGGIWAKTLFGFKYDTTPFRDGWLSVDGREYYVDKYYRLENGYEVIYDSETGANIYYFDEVGLCDKTKVAPDGFYNDRNGLAYVKDGKVLTGLQLIDGDYYYFNTYGYAVKGDYAGYVFDDDYKAVNGILERDGVLCYYENGKPKMAGLVNIDGAYYFAYGSKGQVAIGETYVWESNGLLPEATYEFGADGKMLEGIIDKDGVLCYYKNGQPKMAGLVEVDGAYYFAYGKNGEVAIGETYVWESNGLLPEATYEFGADGKMLQGIVDKDGVLCYYENGNPKMAGLIEIDGAYYFAYGKNGEIAIGKTYVWETNGIELENRNCEFGADGKMLDGIIKKDGTLYYYVMGRPKMAGLIEVDGAYYFAGGAKGEITVGQVQYVWKNEIGVELENGNCEFGADGKMLNGIVEKDGVLCYYEMGRPKMAGLIEIDGAYYFAYGKNGEIAIGKTYVWETNGIELENRNCEFGADGKMLNGIVEKDGVLCYYEMGRPKMAGLIEVGGAYYFAYGKNGEVATDEQYVWETNGLMAEDNYTFGADGKMLDGFVTIDGGLYYYENGQYGEVGLMEFEGDYYFVDYGGKVWTNGTYYVWDTNDLSIGMKYKFDASGRIYG